MLSVLHVARFALLAGAFAFAFVAYILATYSQAVSIANIFLTFSVDVHSGLNSPTYDIKSSPLEQIFEHETMGSIDVKSHFVKLQEFEHEVSHQTVTQYESSRTGMRVVVLDQQGPKLHGYFVLATEIHDDSGAPHTLEHLCFMGSRSYKYKGFLDKLATRVYSSTNAWTATDHTAYTLDTAGWASFRMILPVYLEHVILPTLTDAGCTTEVHHVDGSGNDAGVVYSEMQGIQNTASSLVDLRAKRIMYPEGVGFRYETGGMMEQLRVLTAERIREFHRDMYQPKNLCLILNGEVNHTELLETLDEFEETILDSIPSPNAPFKRPWVESEEGPALSETIVETVEFPEEDEEYGQIEIRFFGPHASDRLQGGALTIVLLYLAGSSASLLDNTLVEKEHLCSGVYYSTEPRPRTGIEFSLSGVETARLQEVEERFFELIREAMEKDLDMNYMKSCIDRHVRRFKFYAESSTASLAKHIITDYLFGKRDGSTLNSLKNLDVFTKILPTWSQDQWKNFIKTYIANAHHITLYGVPSAKLSETLKKTEADRLEKQKEQLGVEGLKRKAEELEAAIEENDREIPSELLAKFKVPSTDSIHFVKIEAARVGPAMEFGRPNNRYQKLVEREGKDMPLFIDVEQIKSDFARINLIISTDTVPLELRPLFSIYTASFFDLPLKRGDKVVEFESVVMQLENDTVGYSIGAASGLGNVECLRISLEVEAEKYEMALQWLKDLLWNSIFDVARLQAVNSRLLADISDSKRSGHTMLTAVHLMTHLTPKSVAYAKSTLVKALYLKRIRHLLKTDPDRVVAMMTSFREHLCRFENMRVMMVGDLDKIPNPIGTWRSFLNGLDVIKTPMPLSRRIDRLSEAGKKLGQHAYVVPIPAIDSSYGFTLANGPSTWNDPQIPALMVATSYMNAVEGPLWVAVRGTGLAYGTTMSYDLEDGTVSLDIYRSPDAYKAFDASKNIVQGHIDGSIEFDPLMLEGAISSIVDSFADAHSTLPNAARTNFMWTVMRGLPGDYMTRMLAKVRAITVPEIKRVLKDVLFPMFEPGKADALITCAPGLKDAIKEGLVSVGFSAEIRDLNSFQDDYGLKTGEPEDDDDSDDDDDDDDDEKDMEDEEGSEGSSDEEMDD